MLPHNDKCRCRHLRSASCSLPRFDIDIVHDRNIYIYIFIQASDDDVKAKYNLSGSRAASMRGKCAGVTVPYNYRCVRSETKCPRCCCTTYVETIADRYPFTSWSKVLRSLGSSQFTFLSLSNCTRPCGCDRFREHTTTNRPNSPPIPQTLHNTNCLLKPC